MNNKNNNDGNPGGLWGSRRAPLTSAQRAPAQPAAPSEPNPRVLPMKAPEEANGDYRAFDIREHSIRMDIRCARGPSRFPSYQYLLDIIFDYEFSSAFTLIYTFMVVEVEGQNLEPVVHAIAHTSCERITEFHPRRHARKPDDGTPLIQKITIVAAGDGGQAE